MDDWALKPTVWPSVYSLYLPAVGVLRTQKLESVDNPQLSEVLSV